MVSRGCVIQAVTEDGDGGPPRTAVGGPVNSGRQPGNDRNSAIRKLAAEVMGNGLSVARTPTGSDDSNSRPPEEF
jgi:hypothetical protein